MMTFSNTRLQLAGFDRLFTNFLSEESNFGRRAYGSDAKKFSAKVAAPVILTNAKANEIRNSTNADSLQHHSRTSSEDSRQSGTPISSSSTNNLAIKPERYPAGPDSGGSPLGTRSLQSNEGQDDWTIISRSTFLQHYNSTGPRKRRRSQSCSINTKRRKTESQDAIRPEETSHDQRLTLREVSVTQPSEIEVGTTRTTMAEMGNDSNIRISSDDSYSLLQQPKTKHVSFNSGHSDAAQTQSMTTRDGAEEPHVVENLPTKRFDVHLDPMLVDSSLSEYFLAGYFRQVDTAELRMFPETQFMKWAQQSTLKSVNDKMVLYAMLSLGSVFAFHQDRLEHNKEFTTVARQAIRKSKRRNNVQHVQANIMMCLVELSLGNEQAALDHARQATAAAFLCRLNNNKHEPSLEHTHYGMDLDDHKICSRQTFWLLCVTERFLNIAIPTYSIINRFDMAQKKALSDSSRSGQTIAGLDTNRLSCYLSATGLTGDADAKAVPKFLTWTVEICDDVQQLSPRIKPQVPMTPTWHSRNTQNGTAQQSSACSEDWSQHASTKVKPFESIGSMLTSENWSAQICNSFAQMASCRYTKTLDASSMQCSLRIQNAHNHARAILQIAQDVMRMGIDNFKPFTLANANPLIAQAVFAALDTFTAAGSIADVLEYGSTFMGLVYSAIELLAELSSIWRHVRKLLAIAQQRSCQLFSSVNSCLFGRPSHFSMSKSMFPPHLAFEHDVTYEASGLQRLSALLGHDGTIREQDVYEIGRKSSI